MSVYYVQLVYIHIMFENRQKHVNIISTRDQKKSEDENISFYFLGNISKIWYNYRDEKLFFWVQNSDEKLI